MEQRTLRLDDGTLVYCYADGSVEWLARKNQNDKNGFIKRTFGFDSHGYLRVRINYKHYFIHRLIAMAFHENPNNLLEVDHLDRNKNNNKPENLRWATRKENCDNKDCVDKSLEKYGIRSCDDRKAYRKQHDRHCLNMIKPDGSHARTGALTPEIYDLLKPLTQKERYIKYIGLKR